MQKSDYTKIEPFVHEVGGRGVKTERIAVSERDQNILPNSTLPLFANHQVLPKQNPYNGLGVIFSTFGEF